MFIGVLLVITWLILLLRYPAKALPVSVAAAVGLALVATWVVWLDNREVKQLARLELRISLCARTMPGRSTAATEDEQRQRRPADRTALAHRGLRTGRYRQPGRQPIRRTTLSRPRRVAGRRAIGKIACRCRPCVPVIARKPWSFAPSDCRAASPTDPLPPVLHKERAMPVALITGCSSGIGRALADAFKAPVTKSGPPRARLKTLPR